MDLHDAIKFIHSDKGLDEAQKQELTNEENKKKLAALLAAGTGAGLGLALAKYKKMAAPAQVVLSALGFGAGMVIYKYWNRERFANYNEKTKMYEV